MCVQGLCSHKDYNNYAAVSSLLLRPGHWEWDWYEESMRIAALTSRWTNRRRFLGADGVKITLVAVSGQLRSLKLYAARAGWQRNSDCKYFFFSFLRAVTSAVLWRCSGVLGGAWWRVAVLLVVVVAEEKQREHPQNTADGHADGLTLQQEAKEKSSESVILKQSGVQRWN